jgi:hypothetical protein
MTSCTADGECIRSARPPVEGVASHASAAVNTPPQDRRRAHGWRRDSRRASTGCNQYSKGLAEPHCLTRRRKACAEFSFISVNATAAPMLPSWRPRRTLTTETQATNGSRFNTIRIWARSPTTSGCRLRTHAPRSLMSSTSTSSSIGNRAFMSLVVKRGDRRRSGGAVRPGETPGWVEGSSDTPRSFVQEDLIDLGGCLSVQSKELERRNEPGIPTRRTDPQHASVDSSGAGSRIQLDRVDGVHDQVLKGFSQQAATANVANPQKIHAGQGASQGS